MPHKHKKKYKMGTNGVKTIAKTPKKGVFRQNYEQRGGDIRSQAPKKRTSWLLVLHLPKSGAKPLQ